MALKNPITLNNWQQGIGPSFYSGFSDMRNANINKQPGILQAAFRSDSTATVVDALIKWAVKDPISGKDYAIDENGQVYRRDSFGTTTDWVELTMGTVVDASGNGLGIWQDYLIVARDANLDAYGPLNSGSVSPSWTNGFATLTSVTDWHPILVSEDDKLYIGNKNAIKRITKVGTFDPSSGGTFSEATVGTLQAEVVIKCMSDYTKRLIAVGIKGNNNIPTQAQLFGYDRTTTLMEERIDLKEDGVNAILAVGTDLYVQAGTIGNMYLTNFSQFQRLPGLNNLQTDTTTVDFVKRPSLVVYPDALKYIDGEILFGLSYGTGGDIPSGLGIYGIKNGNIYHKTTISDGNDGSSGLVRISSIIPLGNQGDYYFAWQSGSSFGIDGVDLLGNVYQAYQTYVDSQFYIVGDSKNPHTFTQIQFMFAKAPTGNNGVKLFYRNTKDEDFTLVGFWVADGSDSGSITMGTNEYAEFNLPLAQQRIVQFRLAINSVQLIEARIK